MLNLKLIKPDLRKRDKFPNNDGLVELVTEDQTPIGKIDVQIRKIRSSELKSRCDSSLVAYSQITTLPVLFIGVDTESKRALIDCSVSVLANSWKLTCP